MYIYVYMYMHIYLYVCMCVYVWICKLGNTGLSLPKSAAAQQASNDWQPNFDDIGYCLYSFM